MLSQHLPFPDILIKISFFFKRLVIGLASVLTTLVRVHNFCLPEFFNAFSVLEYKNRSLDYPKLPRYYIPAKQI